MDLGGNSRTNHEISNSNVFGIQPGVSINLFIKKKLLEPRKAIIRYFQINDNLNKNEKLDILNERGNVDTIQWDEIHPDTKYNWLTRGIDVSFDAFLPLGTKEAKISRQTNVESIFKKYSIGLSTNRDSVVYDFNKNTLEHRLVQFYENYKTELARFQTKEKPPEIDSFVDYEKIKWSSTLKNHLKYSETGNFRQEKITTALYRPFTTSFLYYDSVLIDRPGLFKDIFPLSLGNENTMICVNQSMERPFTVLASDFMADLHMCGGFGTGTQCFPFYTYTQDGNNRSENITDWAFNQYQTQYKDDKITKKDIFNYVYGLLHSPVYREKFEANLKRELPHIPFAPDFWSFANAGKQLADLHVNYETQPEYKLTWIEEESAKVHYRVDKMVLAKDKTKIKYNDFLTLAGIPPEVFEYRLGNRSALEWIIDQYQVSPNKRSGITNDPNRADDPQYIVHLIGKIITVSLATIKLVKSLPQIN